MTIPITISLLLLGRQLPQTVPLPPQIAILQEIQLGEGVAPVTLSADEAGLVAIEKSPKLRLARAALLGAKGTTIQTRSGLLPNVSLTTSRNAIDTLRSSGGSGGSTVGTGGTGVTGSGGSNTGSYSTGVTLSQLIFDFGHTLNLVRQAMANEKAAGNALTREEQSLIYQTKSAFYLFSLDTGLVGVQLANVKDRQAQLDLAQARVNAGPGEPSDLLIARTNLADAIQQLVQARSAALSARIALAIVMGIDPRTPIAEMDSQETAMASGFADYYKEALTTRPDLLQSIQELRAAGYGVQAANSNDLPALKLSGGYNANGQNDPGANQSASVALTLSWALFDGSSSHGKRISAQAGLDTARATLDDLQLTIGSDVATAWSEVLYAQQRLPIANEEVTIATESLRIASGRYKAGIGLFLDVTNAEAALVTAQQLAIAAKIAVSTAWAGLRYAVGESK